MIKINHPIFEETLEIVSDVSKDTTNNEILCASSKRIYNFDKICQKYVKLNNLIRTPCSNDGLYISDEKIIFIEFKNGKLENTEKFYKLLEKNYESLLILFDLELEKYIPNFKSNISFSKTKVEYILVYNEEKNPKDDLKIILAKKAHTNTLKQNILLELKNYLFREVKLISLREFEREILPFLN